MSVEARSGTERRNLVGSSRAELAEEMAGFGAEPFRARQLWHWIYHRGVTDFAAMTNLAKNFRERLAEAYELRRPEISRALVSSDGTRKWLLRFDDAQEIETVHIPESDRGTLCVSSQVGCTLTCTFCHTGTQRLVRNLSAAEIVGQIMIARDALGEWPSPKDDRQLTNIVLMGMGEPLYNFDNVAAAMKIAMDPEGLAISRRKITLSTSGVVPMIERCGKELGVNLAISLHAVTDELRNTLVPLNRKYPLAMLLEACRTYPGSSNARRITFEYVMLKSVNDSPAEARELVRLLKGIPAKVNLIPFNPWPGAPYECSSDKAIKAFSDIVFNAGYSAPVRTPRGRDIFAACGQLKSASVRARRTVPAPQLGDLVTLGVREVRIVTADRLSLLGWYRRPDEGRPVIAYFHGNGGHIGYRAERMHRLAEAGYGVLMPEYRGYGGNPGSPSETGLFADGDAALNFLGSARIDSRRLVLYGESLGTGVAVYLAARHDIAALILEAPYTSIAAVAQYHYPFVPVVLLLRDRFDSASRIAKVKAPILVVHGGRDQVVPTRFTKALYAAAPEPKEIWFSADAGHEDLAGFGALDAAFDFIGRRVGFQPGKPG